MHPVPRPVRLLALAIGVAVLLSAGATATLALLAPALAPGTPASWVLFGFESVVVVAAALAILVGRGRFAESPAMALACIAGTIAVASGLGWQGANRALLGVSLTPLLAGRVLAGAAIALAAAACVLGSDRRAWRQALLGAAMALPAVLVGAAALTGPGRRLIDAALGQSAVQQVAVSAAGALVLGGLLAAGGHTLIRAFERRVTSARAGAAS